MVEWVVASVGGLFFGFVGGCVGVIAEGVPAIAGAKGCEACPQA
jgi:hypothetical protein